MLAQQKLKC